MARMQRSPPSLLSKTLRVSTATGQKARRGHRPTATSACGRDIGGPRRRVAGIADRTAGPDGGLPAIAEAERRSMPPDMLANAAP